MRAPSAQKSVGGYQSMVHGRSGHAIAHTPRSAPCLRIPVGYLALSLPGGSSDNLTIS